MDLQAVLREPVIDSDQLHIKSVEVGVSNPPSDLSSFPIRRAQVRASKLIGCDTKIPAVFFGLFGSEGDLDCAILLKLDREPGSRVDLFGYQWALIHSITPFGVSVIAASSAMALSSELVTEREDRG
jgi:hypothetical protein